MFNPLHRFLIAAFLIFLCIAPLNFLGKPGSRHGGGNSNGKYNDDRHGNGGALICQIRSVDTDVSPAMPHSKPTGPTPPAQSNPVLVADQAAIDAAMKNVGDAQQALRRVSDELLAAFVQTKPWLDATSAVDQAEQDLEAAKKAARDNLLTVNPDYAAAKTAQDKAHAALDAGKATGDDSPDTLGALASGVMTADAAVDSLEKEAFDNDAGCQAALGRLVPVRQAKAQMLADFKSSMRSDPQYSGAQQALDAAEKAHADALAQLASDAGAAAPPPPPAKSR